ncbi:hypothetical protein DFH08DRAFT_914963 [Mycena albidolilacea]|uniref:Uncharacterized protein n=1 Tax=Mycena albidolilacea TaxID=1033008 RepID=A0AAD6ZYS9_9AGAR|nr:hypothetical protein DFH08DRAFT_914963 [Mycena albidolilacea]
MRRPRRTAFVARRLSTRGLVPAGRATIFMACSPQPSHPLPELPPELWILILEYSTYPSSPGGEITAYAPEPSVELPSSFLSTALTPASLAPRLAHYRASMRHKRNLTLVSKQWHQYAQPVLYSFVWLARAAQAKALALTLLCQACCLDPASGPATDTSAGRFIRRLHIETPALERCNPADLRAVLAYAPALEVYSDYRSVRRGALSADLLGALAQGGALRGLSWTNYDDPALVGLGVGLGMGVGVGLGHMGGRLEYLELNFVSSAEGPAKAHFDLAMGGAGAEALSLPALKTLKVALDNATFAVLSTWDLPALRNLSVLSADFSYASAGFRRFFAVHGARLRQLELGHSSAHIEEHYLTAPPPTAAGANGGGAAHGLSLAEWCPHLEEFVCSADAAWDWQHPDWIAPHLLLPAHPTVTLIGIRGIDARLWDGDAAFFGLRAQVESLLRREAFPRLRYVRDLSAGSDALRRGRGGMRVVKFWEGVLERCRREQVWLEDWRGWNVTSGSLRRARARVAAGEVA